MKVTNRRLHYWLAALSALPVLVIVVSGLLLQVKKDVAWIQPPEKRGEGEVPGVSMEQVLEACRSVPRAAVRDWKDVERLDFRPAKGLIKVTTAGRWEIQIDAGTGRVLQVAYRRSDLIESIHDGSWFHPAAKKWIFLPAGLVLLVLWATGIWLFLQPFLARRSRRDR